MLVSRIFLGLKEILSENHASQGQVKGKTAAICRNYHGATCKDTHRWRFNPKPMRSRGHALINYFDLGLNVAWPLKRASICYLIFQANFLPQTCDTSIAEARPKDGGTPTIERVPRPGLGDMSYVKDVRVLEDKAD